MTNKKQMKMEMWPIDKILPYEQNVKKHDPEQVAGIVASIQEFGWDVPIVVDKNGVIIKGHGRRLAAISLAMTEVPVVVRTDLNAAQVRLARLADNRVALGGVDIEMTRKELKELNAELASKFFTKKELDFLNADLGDVSLDGFVPDLNAAIAQQETTTQEAGVAALSRRVPLSKAFGFSDVAGASEIYVTRFMAMIEAQTEATGEAALVAYAKSLFPAA